MPDGDRDRRLGRRRVRRAQRPGPLQARISTGVMPRSFGLEPELVLGARVDAASGMPIAGRSRKSRSSIWNCYNSGRVPGFVVSARPRSLPSRWAMTGANSGRNRQPLDWPMIQVGAARLGRLCQAARAAIVRGAASLQLGTKHRWPATLFTIGIVTARRCAQVAHALNCVPFGGCCDRKLTRKSEESCWRQIFQQRIVARKTVLPHQAVANVRNWRSIAGERQSRSPIAPSRKMPDRSSP